MATPDATLAKEISDLLRSSGDVAVPQLDIERTVESATCWRAEVVVLDARTLPERRYLFDDVKRLKMLRTVPAVVVLHDGKPHRGFLECCDGFGGVYRDIAGRSKSLVDTINAARNDNRAFDYIWRRRQGDLQ